MRHVQEEMTLVSGYVLAESIRPGARLEGIPLTLKKVQRDRIEHPAPDQPGIWTTVEFTFDEADADRLAQALADVVDEHGGWYTNFTIDHETWVIFAHQVFRYRAGDTEARAKIASYGRSVGVPARQLDWLE